MNENRHSGDDLCFLSYRKDALGVIFVINCDKAPSLGSSLSVSCTAPEYGIMMALYRIAVASFARLTSSDRYERSLFGMPDR